VQANYSPRGGSDAAETGPSLSLSHILRIVLSYRQVIATLLLAVALGYAILAIAFYLRKPASRMTSIQFSLNFDGATEARYPNGLRFSAVDIVATPILQRVYERDRVSRLMSLQDFTRSFFVLETNPGYEALVREYEARLSDSRLTPIDRERIQKEFDMRREALPKNVFSVNFQHDRAGAVVPESMARGFLIDALNTWANVAVNEQHVVDYRVPVLSPQIIGSSKLPDESLVESLLMLRSEVNSVLYNIVEVSHLPGAELIRTSDRLSLSEIQLRVQDIIRFRIEPLVIYAIQRHLMRDPSSTLRFVQSQLAYDQRRLDVQTATADSMRQTLAMYTQRPDRSSEGRTAEQPQHQAAAPSEGGGGVTPQLSETFLDRLVSLSAQSADSQYRQNIAEKYREAITFAIPIGSEVAYHKSIIEQLKTAGSSTDPAASGYVQAQLGDVRNEMRQLIGKVNEIYKIESNNLHPAEQLFTLTAPAVTHIERSVDVDRLVITGILVLLVSFVLIIAGVLLHNQMRREDESEIEEAAEAEAEAAPMTTPALT